MDPKHLIPTVKHGDGSVIVWEAVADSGVGRLVFVLENNLQASVDKLCLGTTLEGWIN
ncbi:hypothetical protein KR026_005589 [Drosophila bipectinata]|nr:hypothetical protein KR026_005589 [Drosophila bipectinata]